MAPTPQEISLLINPLVPNSVAHNRRVLTNLHSITSFLFGLAAGILALRSTHGFLFYLIGTLFVSFLFQAILIGFGNSGGGGSTRVVGAGAYFPGNGELVSGGDKNKACSRKGAWRDVWLGGGVMGEAVSGFVLGWAGVGGVLR